MRSQINYPVIGKIIGLLLIVEGIFMLLSLPFSFYYGAPDLEKITLFVKGRDFWPLLIAAAITIFPDCFCF
ncbi:MAG: hypothetical protein U5L09_00995 [Bacteroidales bacterium]|nr:hypothetical protein [Bacteroidales bacterium]